MDNSKTTKSEHFETLKTKTETSRLETHNENLINLSGRNHPQDGKKNKTSTRLKQNSPLLKRSTIFHAVQEREAT